MSRSLKEIREPSSAEDYDGDGDKTEGVAHEIEGLQAVLLSSMQAYAKEVVGTGIAYDPAAYPYWFADADGDGKGDMKDDKPVAYNGLWTPRLLKAAYNYQVSIKDPGAFAHGGKYIIELLFDSIEDINSSEKLTTKFDVSTLTREDAGHFDGAGAAWRHWDVDSEGKPVYTVEAACAKCHSASGLPTLLAGQEIPEAGVPAGNGLMCVTCHDVQAGFPARFKVNDVVLPSGKTVTFGQDADSNLCIMCHQGRASKKSVDDRIAQFNAAGAPDTVVEAIKDANGNDVKFGFINSHYLGIANEWFGTDAQGAYEYDGKTYVGANTHPALEDKPGCVGCHDVHNGEVKVELCQQCHGTTDPDTIRGMSDATIDYNGNGNTTEGVRDEYRTLREALYAEIQTYAKKTTGTAIVYDTNAYPYWYADANGNGERDADEKAFTTWTPRLLKAAYNYNFFRKTPGAYAHNAKYSIQIIIDSIEDLGGDISKFVRP
ncbi:MAG: cytochrome c3 family protein [Anaerolineales bacterium]